jgi:hypothetical protein
MGYIVHRERRLTMPLVHVDTKKRVALGRLLQGRDVEAFEASILPTGEIVLKPMMVVPEHWIYKNPEALASLRRGLEDSAAGRTRPLSEIRKKLRAKARAKG